jgi:hypothetical protein
MAEMMIAMIWIANLTAVAAVAEVDVILPQILTLKVNPAMITVLQIECVLIFHGYIARKRKP